MSAMREFSPLDPAGPGSSLHSRGPLHELLEHEGFVRLLARGLVRDEAAAEDLAQDTWLRVLRNPPTAVHSPSSWLRNVVRQTAISSYRAEKARNAREHRWACDARAHPQGELEDAPSVRAQLARALEALSPEQREVIALRYFEGLPPRSISARIGVPVETVRTRTKRALAKLRERLDCAYGGDRQRWMPAMALMARLPRIGAYTGGGLGLLAVAVCAVVCTAALRGPTDPVRVVDRSHARARPDVPSEERLVHQRAASSVSAPAVEEGMAFTAGPESGSLSLAFVEQRTGEPAAGVAFTVSRADPTELDVHTGASDDRGRASLELEDGLWRLAPARGRSVRIEVHSGERSECTIAVPTGVEVRGRVLTTGGRVLPGALVFATAPFRDDEIAERTLSDADGRFRFANVDPNVWVGATESAHRDSDIVFVNDPGRVAQPSREVELRLKPVRSVAIGVVRDALGRPIGGARVEPALNLRGKLTRPPLQAPVAPARRQDARISDEHGVFDLSDLQPYTWNLVVRAPGFAPTLAMYQPEIAPEPGSESVVEIVLGAGRSVRGRITLPDGAPAPGAEVTVRARGMALRSTRTDGDGRYALDLLPWTELHLWARALDADTPLVSSASFASRGDEPGAVVWSPTLTGGGLLRGRCLGENGQPARDLWVAIHRDRSLLEDWTPNENPMRPRFAAIAADGTFELAAPESASYRVDVWDFRAGARHVAHFPGVRAGADEQTFRLRPARSSITGFFLDDSRDERGPASLWINADSWPRARQLEVEPDGFFAAEGLTAGTYSLLSWRAGKTPRRAARVELGELTQVELEPIVLERPGELSVPVCPDFAPADAPVNFVLYERASFGTVETRAVAFERGCIGRRAVAFRDVLPGDYVLTAGGSERAMEYYPVSVRSSETTEVELAPRACASGPIELALPAGERGRSQLHFVLFDAEKRVRVRVMRPTTTFDGAAGVLQLPVRVPPGRYAYRAQLVGGEYAARGTLDVHGVGARSRLGWIELQRVAAN